MHGGECTGGKNQLFETSAASARSDRMTHMSWHSKDYLGAIECDLDGFQYEVSLRQESARGYRGIWTCLTCDSTHQTSGLATTEHEAMEVAKCDLSKHHADSHETSLARTSSINKPR
jgi:hypothetical protein